MAGAVRWASVATTMGLLQAKHGGPAGWLSSHLRVHLIKAQTETCRRSGSRWNMHGWLHLTSEKCLQSTVSMYILGENRCAAYASIRISVRRYPSRHLPVRSALEYVTATVYLHWPFHPPIRSLHQLSRAAKDLTLVQSLIYGPVGTVSVWKWKWKCEHFCHFLVLINNTGCSVCKIELWDQPLMWWNVNRVKSVFAGVKIDHPMLLCGRCMERYLPPSACCLGTIYYRYISKVQAHEDLLPHLFRAVWG